MLATKADLAKISYPILCSPKIDGIRCLRPHGMTPVTRTFKEIPNRFLREKLTRTLPEGIDGELWHPDKTFHQIQSEVMSFNGESDVDFYAFDFVRKGLDDHFLFRFSNLKIIDLPDIELVSHTTINNEKELLKFEENCIQEGYEGAMIRSIGGPYKCGRSTVNEGYLLKLKRFQDAEGIVVGFEELLHNENEAKVGQLGYLERSHLSANKAKSGMLGALIVKLPSGETFKIGTGFTEEERIHIWANQLAYIGKQLTFKYQPHGTKDLPRCPVFKDFRRD